VTIAEAAQSALRTLARPATTRQIYDEIVKQDLFRFGAKDPVAVLGSAIRRRTEGSKSLRGEVLFLSDERGLIRER